MKFSSRVDEGNHDVASALCDRQALVVVSEATRMDEGPTQPRLHHTAVVPKEPTASTLK